MTGNSCPASSSDSISAAYGQFSCGLFFRNGYRDRDQVKYSILATQVGLFGWET